MRALIAGGLGLLLMSPALAEPLPSAAQILKQEGQFAFSDGSSYYLFKKDGTFDSGPLGISGRTIHGRWTLREPSLFVVTGQWSRVNGISSLSDYRKLTMAIYSPTGVEEKNPLPHYDPIPTAKIYKCYFEIEELVKIKPPK